MKKRKAGNPLSRSAGSRRALFRALIRAVVLHGVITTTKTKAKVIQPKIDRLINLAKKDDLSARRRVYAALANDRETTDSLFQKIAPALGRRSGGYTKIINLPPRRGDNAKMVRIEWVEQIGINDKKEAKRTKKLRRTKGVESKRGKSKKNIKGIAGRLSKSAKK